jgi:RNA polymerase sigma-70 factor (ECF subfamily)
VIEELLGRSAGLVHAIARARLGDGLAAEEAAVESLARIARGLPGLRDPQAYPRWAARVAERCVAGVARTGPPAEPLVAEPVDPAGGPVATAVATERSQRLRHALAELRPRLRTPVLLHFVEGLSYREIARTLGVGLGTVARRMERALAVLRRALGGEP